MRFHKALLGKAVLGKIKEKRQNSKSGLAGSRKTDDDHGQSPKRDVSSARAGFWN